MTSEYLEDVVEGLETGDRIVVDSTLDSMTLEVKSNKKVDEFLGEFPVSRRIACTTRDNKRVYLELSSTGNVRQRPSKRFGPSYEVRKIHKGVHK